MPLHVDFGVRQSKKGKVCCAQYYIIDTLFVSMPIGPFFFHDFKRLFASLDSWMILHVQWM